MSTNQSARKMRAKLRTVRDLLVDPFGGYPKLSDKERQALKTTLHGGTANEVAADLDVSQRTAYNLVDRGLIKISRAEGRTIRKDELPALIFDKLAEAVDLRRSVR